MVEVVLFDVGNTMLQLDYTWLAELATRLGVAASPVDVGRVDAGVRRRLNEGRDKAPDSLAAYFARTGCRMGLSSVAAQEFGAKSEAEHRRDPRGMWRSVAEGARETVVALRERSIAVGVVSNGDGRAEERLRFAGLRELFAVIVDSHLVGVEKPDAQIFRLALRALGAEPETALYVGDLLDVDVEGARNAGLQGVLLDAWDAYPEITGGRIRRLPEILPLLGVPPAR